METQKPEFTPLKNKKYHQGIFRPKHPEKYIGNVKNIKFRSGLELKYFQRIDENPNIIKWASEEFSIPYILSINGKKHNYFPDILIMYKAKDGTIKKTLIEIKPYNFLFPPKKPKRITQSYIKRLEEYTKNIDKWKFAKQYCEQNNMNFVILTEKNLGNGK